MTDLLDKLVTYLAQKLTFTPGENAFYNCMPDDEDECLLLQEEQTQLNILPQIDAEVHRICVVLRSTSNEAASALAQKCWRWLLTDDPAYDMNKTVDTTGIIHIATNCAVYVVLLGNPVWAKTDQQGRKYYSFYTLITTGR